MGNRRSDPFVTCRVYGHAWFEVPDDAGWDPRKMFNHRIVLRCERCGGSRYDGIDSRGEVGARYYVMPEGYSYARDETPTRSALRLAMLRRPLEERQRRVHPVPEPEPEPSNDGAAPARAVRAT